jgi:phospholipid/cholesterol/gamma-HCH transport system substrate-binding protein
MDNLVAGDTISQTQSAVVLENLISQFLFDKAAEPAPAGADPLAPPAFGAPGLAEPLK